MNAQFASLINSTGRGTYCGPASLAICAGIDVAIVESLILEQRRGTGYNARECRAVVGMPPVEWLSVAEALGLLPVNVKVPYAQGTIGGLSDNPIMSFPTFAQWLKLSEGWRGTDVYLMISIRHYWLVRGQAWVDNNTQRPFPLSVLRRYRRSRIIQTYCILVND